MTKEEIREWMQKNVQPCPCCGAGVVIKIDTDERGNRAYQELQAADTQIALVAAEEAEAEIRETFGKRLNPIGGRV